MTMKPMGYWNNKENCLEEAEKYRTIHELQRKCYGCYMGLKRNGWLYDAYKIDVRPMGYWNCKKNVVAEAKKYKSKQEFKKNSKSAYNSMYRNGWNADIESIFENKARHYRGSNDKIHCVYVYEIPEYKTCYVGRTLELKKRDASHRRSRKHSDGTETYDALYRFCDDHNIEIPAPIVKEDRLTGNESLIKEDYWLKEYQKNGWNTLNIAKTGVKSGSLGGVMIWNYDACKEFAKSYQYKSELKEANYSCYYQCLKNDWFDEFGIKDKRVHPMGYWNKKRCMEVAKNCKSISELINKHNSVYLTTKRKGWYDEIKEYFDHLKEEHGTKVNEKGILKDYNDGMMLKDIYKKYSITRYKLFQLFEKNNVKLKHLDWRNK